MLVTACDEGARPKSQHWRTSAPLWISALTKPVTASPTPFPPILGKPHFGDKCQGGDTGCTTQPRGRNVPLGPGVLHPSLVLQKQRLLLNRNAENKPTVRKGREVYIFISIIISATPSSPGSFWEAAGASSDSSAVPPWQHRYFYNPGLNWSP